MSDLGTIEELQPIAGESIPPGEPDAIRIIAGCIEKQVRDDKAKSGLAHRDAHAKAHCCVKAEFRVLDGLPANLRQGLFAEPRSYEAWIRFSSSSGSPQSDRRLDGQGMAIKVMGVADSPSTTQDFVQIDYPVFMVRNAIDYVDLQQGGLLKFFFPGGLRVRLHEMCVVAGIFLQRIRNPLNLRYWSMVPYRLGGDQACKFSSRPTGTPSPFTEKGGYDFLRDNMIKHLATRPATFDFTIQLRTDPAAMPVEDPTVKWSESLSPFVTVAKITIPQQSFAGEQQDCFCENLSFSPWHCLDAHRPLGGINRVRRFVYNYISRLRHELNHAPRKEPTGFSIDS